MIIPTEVLNCERKQARRDIVGGVMVGNSIGSSSLLRMDNTSALAKAHLSEAEQPLSYTMFPTENVPTREYNLLAYSIGAAAMRSKGELYSQVLIWCLSHRLETLHAEATDTVAVSTLRVAQVLERFRRGLIEGSINARFENMSFVELRPIIKNPVNQRRLQIIRGLETHKARTKAELHNGIRLLKVWETQREASLASLNEAAHCAMAAYPMATQAVSLLRTAFVESQQIVAVLMSLDTQLAEARALCANQSTKQMAEFMATAGPDLDHLRLH